MPRKGCDYAWEKPSIAAMKAEDITFACRYLSWDTTGKNLSAGEAANLRAAGIDVVSNWEWGTGDATLGWNKGVEQAREAARLHTAYGGPDGAPIYFSVDEDVSGSSVADYFRGVASVIGLNRTGAYGSYKVIKYLFDTGLITFGWQTYAWSYGAWEPRAQLRQVQNGVIVGGADIDIDYAQVDYFGQWDGDTDVAYDEHYDRELIEDIYLLRQRPTHGGNKLADYIVALLWNTDAPFNGIRKSFLDVQGRLGAMQAALAESAKRETTLQTVVNDLLELLKAGGGDPDTAAILGRIDQVAAEEGEQTKELLRQLGESADRERDLGIKLAEMQAKAEDLQRRLWDALKPAGGVGPAEGS